VPVDLIDHQSEVPGIERGAPFAYAIFFESDLVGCGRAGSTTPAKR